MQGLFDAPTSAARPSGDVRSPGRSPGPLLKRRSTGRTDIAGESVQPSDFRRRTHAQITQLSCSRSAWRQVPERLIGSKRVVVCRPGGDLFEDFGEFQVVENAFHRSGWPIFSAFPGGPLDFGGDQRGGVAQLGERSVRNAEVEGSTPFASTRLRPACVSRGSKNEQGTDTQVPVPCFCFVGPAGAGGHSNQRPSQGSGAPAGGSFTSCTPVTSG